MQSRFTIDPTNLNQEETLILKELLLQHEEQQVIWHDQDYKITIPDKDDPSTLHTVECSLTHDVLIRKSEHDSEKTSYDVMGKIINSGNFGRVHEVLCTLGLLPDGYLWASPHKQRVIKIECYSKTAKNNPLREYQLTKLSGELKAKTPVIIYYESEEEFISLTTLERLTGQTLIDYIENLGDDVVPAEKLMALTFSLIESLERLHQKGIIHRDLTPMNVFFDPRTLELHLFDFGMSRCSTESLDESFNGGTPGFAPPEAYLFQETNEKSDIFALAATIGFLWGAEPMSICDEEGKCETGFTDLMKYEFKYLAQEYFPRKHIKEFIQLLDKMLNSHQEYIKKKLSVDEEEELDLGDDPVENENLKSAIKQLRDERLPLQKVTKNLKRIFLNYFVTNFPSKQMEDLFKASQIAFDLKAKIGTDPLSSKSLLLDSLAMVKDKENIMTVFTLFLGIHAFIDCRTHEEVIHKFTLIENIFNERKKLLIELKEEIINLSSTGKTQRFALEILKQMELNVDKNVRSLSELTLDQIITTRESFNLKFTNWVAKLEYVKGKYIGKSATETSDKIYSTAIPGTIIFPRSDEVREITSQIQSLRIGK